MSWELGDYCTLAEVKTIIKQASATDDTKIEEIIHDTCREIDDFCGRRFYGVVDTLEYHALEDTDESFLFLDDDLAGLIEVTLGDGSVLTASEYVLEPKNKTPKFGIRLRETSTHSWQTFSSSQYCAISVSGTWGYVAGTIPPDVIKRAAMRLSRWRYLELRTAPTSEQSGTGGVGEFNVPSGIPTDIQRMLMPYRSLKLESV